MTTAQRTASYRPLVSQRRPVVIFAVLMTVPLVASVGFGVAALAGSHDLRDGRASVAIGVLWLAAAYLYGYRFAYRLDLDGQLLRFRCILRRGGFPAHDVTQIGGDARFVIVKVGGRRRLTVWGGPGLEEFVAAVREQAPDVTGSQRSSAR